MSISYGDGSSRKRARESSSALPSLLSAWEDDPDYGLIHPSGCDVCASYMAHLAEASYSDNQPSFQIALSDRNHKREVSYYEGVTEGRRRQRSENESLVDDLDRYRAERNEAFDAVGRYRLERNDIREELEYFRAKFDASKVECEQLKQRVAELPKEKRNNTLDMEVLEVEQMLVDPESSPPVVPVQMQSTQTTLTPLSAASVQGLGKTHISTSISTAAQLNSSFGQSPPSFTQNFPQDLPSFINPPFSTLSGTRASGHSPNRSGEGLSVFARQPSANLLVGSAQDFTPSGVSVVFKQCTSESRALAATTPAFGSLGSPKRSAAALADGAPPASGEGPTTADEPAANSTPALTTPTTYAAAARDRSGSTPSAHLQSLASIGAVPPTRPVGLPARPLVAGLPATSTPSTAPVSRSGLPKNIRQLQSLMNAAHQPSNPGALKKVKALCAEAHQTPKEQKTDLHRYLLANWRNPILAGESQLPPVPAPKTNPRLEDPIELWLAYLSAHRGSWPRGVRRDSRGQPHLPDLKASRMVARLRPDVDSTSSSVPARYGFMTYVTGLFSQPGMYQGLVQGNGLRITPEITFKRYTGPLDEMTYEQVARHFADCGVTMQIATHELGPWAREYEASTAPSASQ